MRQLRNVARVESHVTRISEQQRQAAARYEESVRKQAERTCDERRREADTQQRKLQSAEMAEQQRVILRAQMLP